MIDIEDNKCGEEGQKVTEVQFDQPVNLRDRDNDSQYETGAEDELAPKQTDLDFEEISRRYINSLKKLELVEDAFATSDNLTALRARV